MKKIGLGKYLYEGFRVVCHGYYPPDKCIWWEAINLSTECADYHAHTKRDVKSMIDADIKSNESERPSKGINPNGLAMRSADLQ